MTLLDLAAKVEALTAPCRDTDAEVFDAIGMTPSQEAHCKNWCRMDDRTDLTRRLYISAWAPTYTASLDAAMTLVPEGFGWSLDYMDPGEPEGATVGQHNVDAMQLSHLLSPALALTAAALRARAAISGASS